MGWRADAPDFASVNLSEPGAPELAALLAGLGVAVEAGISSADDADRLTVVLADGPLVSGNRELVRTAVLMTRQILPSVGLTGGEAVVLRRWPCQHLGPAQPVPARPRRLEA